MPPATSRRVLRPSKLLLSTLLTAATAMAQEPVPVPAATPAVPPVVPGAASPNQPRPTTADPNRPPASAVIGNRVAAPQGDLAPLYFPNADVRDVLDYYGDLTGKTLLIPGAISGGGSANIYIHTGPLGKDDRIKIIDMTLNLNGIFILPTEDPNIMKVAGVALPPKAVGVPFIDDEKNLPANEQVVMFLMKLKFQDATELANTLQAGFLMQNPAANISSVVPLVKTNSLLITENTATIRTLLRFIRAVDEKPVDAVSKFFTLVNAQAEEVVTNLNTLFEQPTSQQPGSLPGSNPNAAGGAARRGQPAVQPALDAAGNPMPNTGGVNPEQPAPAIARGGPTGAGGDLVLGTEDSLIVGKVKLTADKRTNRVHVVARKSNMQIIEKLIEEYDANVELPAPFVRHIRFRPVEEMMEAVLQSIVDPGERTASGAGGANALGQRTNPNTGAGANTGANRFGGGANAGGGGQFGGGGTGGGESGGLSEGLEVSAMDPTPIAQQVGKSTIIADRRNQTLIVVGTKDVKDKVSALVDQMDVRQPQVMIHTVVGELRLSRNEQFGIDYILRNGGLLTGTTPPTDPTTPTDTSLLGFVNGGGTFVNANNLLSQQAITKVLAGGTSGLSGVVLSGNALDVAVNAFEGNNRFRVVTRPSIFTLNAKRAIITSGEEVPVPSSTITGGGSVDGGLNQSTTISYKPIELRLEVLPLINNDREVTLEVVQNISERAGNTVIDNNTIPNITRRALKTNVIVPNNGTLILGGLVKESKDFQRNGILFLSRIPWVGPLFGDTTKDKLRTELIVMMRPVVTYNPGDTSRLRERSMQYYNMPPNIEDSISPTGIWGEAPKPKVITRPVGAKTSVFNPRR